MGVGDLDHHEVAGDGARGQGEVHRVTGGEGSRDVADVDPEFGVVVPHLAVSVSGPGVAGDLAGRDREQELGAGTHEVRGAQVDDRSVRDLGQGPQLGLGREPLGVAVLGDQPDHVAEGAGDGHGVEPVAHAVGVGLGGHRPRAVAGVVRFSIRVVSPSGLPIGQAQGVPRVAMLSQSSAFQPPVQRPAEMR